jgi:hypothetical protein
MSPEALKKAGVGPNLLRLSVGIEDVNDLIKDLDDALQKIHLESLSGSKVKDPTPYSKSLVEACL